MQLVLWFLVRTLTSGALVSFAVQYRLRPKEALKHQDCSHGDCSAGLWWGSLSTRQCEAFLPPALLPMPTSPPPPPCVPHCIPLPPLPPSLSHAPLLSHPNHPPFRPGKPVYYQYTQALDWAIKVMTGLGRGASIPLTDLQHCLLLSTVITGIILYALMITTISDALLTPSLEARHRDHLQMVSDTMVYQVLPSPDIPVYCAPSEAMGTEDEEGGIVHWALCPQPVVRLPIPRH